MKQHMDHGQRLNLIFNGEWFLVVYSSSILILNQNGNMILSAGLKKILL